MKIIQSHWSKPSEQDNSDIYGRSIAGFMDRRFYYMSWALSCLTLKKYYGTVELFTDKKGKELLIDKLKLPYSKVTVCLDELNHYNSKLWAIGKIKTYQMQKEPFIHVDGDVFIWKSFGNTKFHKQQLIVQNIEKSYEFYEGILKSMCDNLDFIPDIVNHNYKNSKNLTAINAGIIGGNDISFFQEYTNSAFEFVDKNINKLESVNIGLFNCVYEQYLFYCMAKSKHIKITPFLELERMAEFVEVMCFNLIPFNKTYIHLMGLAKQNIYACEQVEMRLRYEFAYHYDLISSLFEKPYFPEREERFLKLKDTYKFLGSTTINHFLEKSFQLSSHVKIVNEGENAKKLIYTSPQTSQKEEIQLDGWDSVLEAFNEPTSGNEILEVLEDGKTSTNEELNNLKLDIVSFLTEKLVYKDILTFA